MKTTITLAAALVSATLATAAFARGPGNCQGPGRMAGQPAAAVQGYGPGGCLGQGGQARNRMRDPARNPTGQPIRARARLQQPGSNPAIPATPPAGGN